MKVFYPIIDSSTKFTEDFIEVYNKFDNSAFAKVFLANNEMLENAISLAKEALEFLTNLSSKQKYDILYKTHILILENKSYLAEIISIEAGKPLKFAIAEVERAAQTFMVAAEEAKRITNEVISLDWLDFANNTEAIVKHFPIGIVAGITPFNFPLNLVAHKVAPAIAASCPIIIKPASYTPISAIELAKIMKRAGLHDGVFSVLPMSHKVSSSLFSDERIKKISFTGSPEIGWKMKKNCEKKKITLELGGNAASIVTPSADINEAVNKSNTGAFAYSGQVCIHTQRIYVHETLFDEFVNNFIEKTKKQKFGDPQSIETDISVMIDLDNALRVEQWINEAIKAGAEILFGGKRDGSYVEPTIITKTNNRMKVCSEEIFGPVVIIEKYNSFNEAIEMVNDSKFGLQASVFTNNLEEMNLAFKKLEVGGVLINQATTFRLDHMPYGGIKDSGFGREGVKYAIKEMSELKLLVKPV